MENGKEGEDRRGLVTMLAVVALGEISNSNPLIWIKFCGSNRLFRRGLVGAIPEINFRPCSEFLSD